MQYETWYEFKRDCEGHLGHWLSNRRWLDLKPEKPLPWNEVDLQIALLEAHGRPGPDPAGRQAVPMR